MNKEYICIDEKVIVEDGYGNKSIIEYNDKIEEILMQENLIETMENRITILKKTLKEDEESNKKSIPYIFLINILIICSIITTYTNIIDTIIAGSILLPLTALIELESYKLDKHLKNKRSGNITELTYLKKEIVKEKEKLEDIKKTKTHSSENKPFSSKEVNDLEKMRKIRRLLNFYNDLGYNAENYYKYYQHGKLEEKLKKEYSEAEIIIIKEYLIENQKSLVKKYHKNKSRR